MRIVAARVLGAISIAIALATADGPATQAAPVAFPAIMISAPAGLRIETAASHESHQTGLPLPRFASLRADEVNMRAGPGIRYPVEWIYHRRGFPVEIIAEFDNWRKVRDSTGAVGWIHRSMLTGKRTAVTMAPLAVLHRSPDAGAPPIAKLKAGVVGTLDACAKDWCQIEADGLSGWIKRPAIWGVLPGEKFD